MNIGLDFGSTYSILSNYREAMAIPQLLKDGNSSDIPSVVAVCDDYIEVGSYAKDLTGESDYTTYKAFKMLLMEKNEKLLKERQFDKNHTPQWAAKIFLNQLVQNAKRDFGDEEIENLVIGAPDVWFQKFETLSGRAVIRDICQSIEGVKGDGVRVYSEPVLASAYFAYNFQKEKKKPFEGHILIIDYGGGTLDLSLTEIKNLNGNTSEIRMLETNGAGENTEHSIGNAGIIYMEELMKYVISKNKPELADSLIGTPAFYKAVNLLENEIKHRASDIENVVSRINSRTLTLLERSKMGRPIRCGRDSFQVTMADLLKVYDTVIRPVFEQKMDEMIRWAKEEYQIDVRAKDLDNFRIALVGGFGKFYPVRAQMYEKFGIVAGTKGEDEEGVWTDKREDGIITQAEDRECAISYGASLVAAGVYKICDTAPYSIGLITSEQEQVNYFVGFRDEIQPEKPEYLKDPFGDEMILTLGGDWADQFVIDYGHVNSEKIRFKAKEKLREKLEKTVKNGSGEFAMGVSFGRSSVLRLHVKELITDYRTMTEHFSDEETVVEVGIFEDEFDKIK